MDAQRRPQSNPQNLGVFYISWWPKKDFINVINLRVLRWGNYLRLSGWMQCNHKQPYKRRAGGAERDVTVEAEFAVYKGHELKKVGWELEKARELILSGASKRNSLMTP